MNALFNRFCEDCFYCVSATSCTAVKAVKEVRLWNGYKNLDLSKAKSDYGFSNSDQIVNFGGQLLGRIIAF